MKKIFSIIMATVMLFAVMPRISSGDTQSDVEVLPTAYCDQYYKHEVMECREDNTVTAEIVEGDLPTGLDLVFIEGGTVGTNGVTKKISLFYLAGIAAVCGEYSFTVEYTEEGADKPLYTHKYSLNVENPIMTLPDAFVAEAYSVVLFSGEVSQDDYKYEITDGSLPEGLEISVIKKAETEMDSPVIAHFCLSGTPALPENVKNAEYSFKIGFEGNWFRDTEISFRLYVVDKSAWKYDAVPELETGVNQLRELIQINKDEKVIYDENDVPGGMRIYTEPVEDTDKLAVIMEGTPAKAFIGHMVMTVCSDVTPSDITDGRNTGKPLYGLIFRLDIRTGGIQTALGYVGEYYRDYFYDFEAARQEDVTITAISIPKGFELCCELEDTNDGTTINHLSLKGIPEKAGFFTVVVKISDGEYVKTIDFDLNVIGIYRKSDYRDTVVLYKDTIDFHMRTYDSKWLNPDEADEEEIFYLKGNTPKGTYLEVTDVEPYSGTYSVKINGKADEKLPYRFIYEYVSEIPGMDTLRRVRSFYVVDEIISLGQFMFIATNTELIKEIGTYAAYEILQDAGEGITIRDTDADGNKNLTLHVTDKAENGHYEIILRVKKTADSEPELISLQFTKLVSGIGDANSDGKVNTGDAFIILKYCADMVELTDEQVQNADVNNDGSVNTGDAAKILRFVAGMGPLG